MREDGVPGRARVGWTSMGVGFDRGMLVRAAVICGLLLFVLLALPRLLSAYYISVSTGVAVFAVVALGLNLLFGRVGLVSLGQMALLAFGAWVAARLFFLTGLPFPVVLLLAGLITAAVGTLLGLPALRLGGLHLALITLMFAGLVAIVVPTTNFPNGGSGVLGHTESSSGGLAVRRPGIAESDPAYFRYTVIVAAVMFLIALLHVGSKAGRAWAAIRQSEPAALAAGVNITLYKLYAFTLASFMTGVAGGLYAGYVGQLYSYQFSGARTIDSVTLLAVVLMGGIFSVWGAVVAALLQQLLPALLNDWFTFFQKNPDFLLVLFGIGVLQVIVTAPEGIVSQFPRDMRRLGGLLLRLVRRPARSEAKSEAP
ncbi:branched-chain amino acid ABC transporter permease [Gaiella sp.]|uniref:branched-chain amino acid ABC transporter permease n=1 Tax=Gaiella sp. TaxID=2663207 RepID=UPI002E37537A|nr:branched-chain amino acid ABC transporter permease [Gaiella sp.]HEX5585304.1 branched-chain amino acid ABC transporter permease [Gaiella sp.]